jgi:hypothetical protein
MTKTCWHYTLEKMLCTKKAETPYVSKLTEYTVFFSPSINSILYILFNSILYIPILALPGIPVVSA